MPYEIIPSYAPQGTTEPTTPAGKAKGWLAALGLMGIAILLVKYTGPKKRKPRKNPAKKRKARKNPRRKVVRRRATKASRRPKLSKAKRRAAALKGWRRRR